MRSDLRVYRVIPCHPNPSRLRDTYITIGDSDISQATKSRNLDVIFDSSMSFNHHISSIVRSAAFHMRNIGK